MAERAEIVVRQAAKERHDLSECEDAAAIGGVEAADGAVEVLRAPRIALVDGASASYDARRWARFLAAAVSSGDGSLADGIDAAQRAWAEAPAPGGGDPSWLEEAARARGNWATCLVIDLGPGAVHAQAVGDTCLVHVRGDRLVSCFPVTAAAGFGSTPDLVCDDPALPATGPVVHQYHAPLVAGDRLLALTDAIAEWFLSQHEGGCAPSELVREIDRAAPAFGSFTAQEREAGRLRDDDVTLVSVGVA